MRGALSAAKVDFQLDGCHLWKRTIMDHHARTRTPAYPRDPHVMGIQSICFGARARLNWGCYDLFVRTATASPSW